MSNFNQIIAPTEIAPDFKGFVALYLLFLSDQSFSLYLSLLNENTSKRLLLLRWMMPMTRNLLNGLSDWAINV
jgi:hypothetical protein